MLTSKMTFTKCQTESEEKVMSLLVLLAVLCLAGAILVCILLLNK